MDCTKCGGANPDISKFCGHCGNRMSATPAPADIKKTAAFDLGQLPFGGGGGGSGPTLVQSALTPEPAGAAGPNDTIASPLSTPTPSAAPGLTASSDPVSASAGPTTVQPVVADEPEAPEPVAVTPAPVTPAPEPAATPEPAASGDTHVEAEPAPKAPLPAVQVEAKAPAAEAAPSDSEAAPAPAARPKVKVSTVKAASAGKADAPGADREGTPAPGQFRETKWFMDALDPEALNRVEIEDIRDRDQHFVDDGSAIDESFSLRSGMHDKVRPAQLNLAKAEFQAAEDERRSSPMLPVLVIAVIGGLAAAAWFLFLR